MKKSQVSLRKFGFLNGLFVLFVLVALLLSLYFRGTVSLRLYLMNRIPTTMSWNVFLALVAYDAAYFAQRVEQRWMALLLGFIWFGFYPNTFYMITDASHFADWLSIDGKFDLPLGVSGQQLSYFGLLSVGIFMGVTLGLWSILLILDRFFAKRKYWAAGFVFVMSFLSSIAIFAGKLVNLRLNTWNLVTEPLATLKTLLSIIRPEDMTFVLGFTAMQCFLILFFELGKKEKVEK